jgi:spore coat polysaccharide biosynthesis protein SpsF
MKSKHNGTIGCIIQARMSSTRLPGKVMMKVENENTILDCVINQLQSSKEIKDIVIATTDQKEDDVIVEFVKRREIKYFRGSEKDVLDRYYQCAKKFNFAEIIRITSDNPLIDYEVADTVVKYFKLNNYDYITTSGPWAFNRGETTDLSPPTSHCKYPSGYDVEVFTFSALENAWKNAKLPSEREHVTPYIFKNKEIFRQTSIGNSEDLSRFRCTVDTKYDLELIQKIYSNIKKRPILLYDVIKLLKANPELVKINAHAKADGYIKSLKEDKKLV